MALGFASEDSQRRSSIGAMYLSLPPTRHDLTQGQKPEGQFDWC